MKRITLLLVLVILSLTSCQAKTLHAEENFKLHTLVALSTYGELKPQVYDEIWSALDRIDATMSMQLETSALYQLNQTAYKNPVALDEDLYGLIKKAISFSEIDPLFDVTVGPLVALWGIGTENARVPSPDEITTAKNLIDYKKITLDDKNMRVSLEEEGMAIDLGAIAKGYAADLTKEILLKNRIDSAIINYGGNILAVGSKDDGSPWRIGVQHPDQSRGQFIGVIELIDKSIVTSGIYERFLEQEGKTYHHILDPNTGYPVENNLLGVSIISDDSIDGDALSTMVFARGLVEGYAWLADHPQYDAIFITKDYQVYLTPGIQTQFKLVDNTFRIATL